MPPSHYILCISIIDLDAHGSTEGPSTGGLQFGEPPPPPLPTPSPTPPPPEPKPPSRHSSPSPPRQRPRYLPRALPGQYSRGMGQRRGLGRGQMFEDPAVMRMVQGRPSLKVMQVYIFTAWSVGSDHYLEQVVFISDLFLLFKGLDSAIVDCGNAMYRNSFEDDVSFHFESH